MKAIRMEVTMDMTDILEQISEEECKTTMNCAFPVPDISMAFERAQKDAGLITDITWDMSWNGALPVIERKSGDRPLNFNYMLYSVKAANDDAAKSFIEDHGRKLIKLLHKHRLGSYQGVAYAKENILYLLFNLVDSKGHQFGRMEEMKLSLAFRNV